MAVNFIVGSKQKTEIIEKAHNVIILCLGDNPLMEVSKEKNAVNLWKKLEGMY